MLLPVVRVADLFHYKKSSNLKGSNYYDSILHTFNTIGGQLCMYSIFIQEYSSQKRLLHILFLPPVFHNMVIYIYIFFFLKVSQSAQLQTEQRGVCIFLSAPRCSVFHGKYSSFQSKAF